MSDNNNRYIVYLFKLNDDIQRLGANLNQSSNQKVITKLYILKTVYNLTIMAMTMSIPIDNHLVFLSAYFSQNNFKNLNLNKYFSRTQINEGTNNSNRVPKNILTGKSNNGPIPVNSSNSFKNELNKFAKELNNYNKKEQIELSKAFRSAMREFNKTTRTKKRKTPNN